MRLRPFNNIDFTKSIGTTIVSIAIVVLFLIVLPSCRQTGKQMGEAIFNRDSVSGITTRGVTTLISDSGRISYKIEAEEWKIFDKASPSYWSFEKGVYLENYDDSMHVKATIKADTAYYYEKAQLWELRSNVEIMNEEEERIYTSLMFWNQKEEKVYSDRYIRRVRADEVVTGIGFTSNQQFTDLSIANIQGRFPIDKEKKQEPASVPADTVTSLPADTINAGQPAGGSALRTGKPMKTKPKIAP